MTRNLFICLFMLLSMHAAIAQNITAKVIDSQSLEGLPYANIEINGENIISNAEGSFTLTQKNTADDLALTVTYLGYNGIKITVVQLKKNQFIIKLNPGVFELETVHISNAKPNADSIIANVKRKLAVNYKSNTQSLKNMLFYRESQTFKPVKLDVEITKSTGYSKEGLEATNKQLHEFTSNLIAHPPQEFTEILGNYYTATKKVNDKPMLHSKFEVVKAIKLKDKNRAVALIEIQEKATGILFQHLDSTKFYRIKSGLFGTRDTVLGHDAKKDINKTKTSQIASTKSSITSFVYHNSFISNKRLDFVTNHELYNYTYQGAVPSGSQYVYVLKFKPKKSAAKYTGTLYISDTDYAVVKAEYTLAEGKKLSGVNLKFLLGIKQSENVSKGTVIYKERFAGGGYFLQYASEEIGQYVYINRPLKFIEITNADKDVAAFDLKVETNVIEKREYFNMSKSAITDALFNEVKEAEFNYLQLDSYNPNIWKEYSAIEPLEEMKQFKALD